MVIENISPIIRNSKNSTIMTTSSLSTNNQGLEVTPTSALHLLSMLHTILHFLIFFNTKNNNLIKILLIMSKRKLTLASEKEISLFFLDRMILPFFYTFLRLLRGLFVSTPLLYQCFKKKYPVIRIFISMLLCRLLLRLRETREPKLRHATLSKGSTCHRKSYTRCCRTSSLSSQYTRRRRLG